eukprot:12600758-Alexandrium_andersonii.AAC.1
MAASDDSPLDKVLASIVRIGERTDVGRGLRDSLLAEAARAAASAAVQPEPKAAVGEAFEQCELAPVPPFPSLAGRTVRGEEALRG